jgi:hypothetical protein
LYLTEKKGGKNKKMRSPPISHTHLAGAMRHRPGRTWKETSSFAGCRLKKRKRTGEMVISGDDEFTYVSFYQADPWVVSNHGFSFVWQAFFLSYENKQLFYSNTDFGETFLRTMKQLFNFIGKHRFNNTR